MTKREKERLANLTLEELLHGDGISIKGEPDAVAREMARRLRLIETYVSGKWSSPFDQVMARACEILGVK